MYNGDNLSLQITFKLYTIFFFTHVLKYYRKNHVLHYGKRKFKVSHPIAKTKLMYFTIIITTRIYNYSHLNSEAKH